MYRELNINIHNLTIPQRGDRRNTQLKRVVKTSCYDNTYVVNGQVDV